MQNQFLILVNKAYAVTVGVPFPWTEGRTNYSFNSYVYALLNFSISMGFVLSGLMIVYGGIKYILSQGNQTQTSDAKDVLISALIGFSLLLLIKMILNTLNIPLATQ